MLAWHCFLLIYIWTLFSAVVTSQFSSEQLSVLDSQLRAHPGSRQDDICNYWIENFTDQH